MTTATSPISPVTPEQYAAALARADADNVITLKKTTEDYGYARNVKTTFHVYSGKSKKIYHVSHTPETYGLVCDCEAGNNGVYCKHRARVHRDIELKVWSI